MDKFQNEKSNKTLMLKIQHLLFILRKIQNNISFLRSMAE